MAGVPGQGQDPALALLGRQEQDGRPGRLGTDHDQLGPAERPGAQPQVPAGVHEVDPDLLFGRRAVPDLAQPCRCPRAAAGGVDDEAGGEQLLRAAAGGPDPRAGDPVAGRCRGQAGHLALVHDRDVGQGPDSAPDLALQERPARHVARGVRRAVLAQQVTAEREPQLPEIAHHRHPRRRQASQEPREQVVEDLRAAGQQRVRVPALRHPLAMHPCLWQHVTFDDRHPLVRIRQHLCRKQPAHARPQHDRVVTDLAHLLPPDESPPRHPLQPCWRR